MVYRIVGGKGVGELASFCQTQPNPACRALTVKLAEQEPAVFVADDATGAMEIAGPIGVAVGGGGVGVGVSTASAPTGAEVGVGVTFGRAGLVVPLVGVVVGCAALRACAVCVAEMTMVLLL
jgi:hypothetical protein